MTNETVIIPEKKTHHITGSVMFPLAVGARAIVNTDQGSLATSEVAAIQYISPAAIIFETQNSHYQVMLKTPLEAGCAG